MSRGHRRRSRDAEGLQDRFGQSRTLRGIGSRADFVDQHQSRRARRAQDFTDRLYMPREGREIGLDGLLSGLDPESVNALRLVPKEHSPEAQEFSRIDIFYDRDTALPVGILALELNQNRQTVLLREVKRNPEFDEEMLTKLDIADPDPGEWKIDIQPWIPRP